MTAVIGVFLLGIGCAGYLFRPLGWGRRAWACLTGLLLLPPPSTAFWVAANLAGLALGGLLVLLERNGTALRRAEFAAK